MDYIPDHDLVQRPMVTAPFTWKREKWKSSIRDAISFESDKAFTYIVRSLLKVDLFFVAYESGHGENIETMISWWLQQTKCVLWCVQMGDISKWSWSQHNTAYPYVLF